MRTLLQDLHYAARMLIKSRGFTAVAVLSLALGIGANTTVFSVVSAALLTPLPYSEPERLVLLWGESIKRGDRREQVSATDVADWRARNHVFEDVATYGDWRPLMSGGGEPERVAAAQVGDGYFKVMRGKPLLGRTFLPEEQEDGKDDVVVLGQGLWQRQFGGDAGVVGKTVMLNGRKHIIVGVMPAEFKSLPAGLLTAPAELYRPVAEPPDETQRSSRHLRAIARLKPTVTLEEARAEMTLIARQLEVEHQKTNAAYGVYLVQMREDLVGNLRPALLMLFGAVMFVLLIACANVGNLLLARSAARQKEIAIRSALGAGRGRIVRQLLTESVLLALVGGALGLLAALWGTGLIEVAGGRFVPWLGRVEINAVVLAFTFLVSVLAGVVFGLAPALGVSRPRLSETLKEGGRNAGAGASRSRLRSSLVVVEVALALVLLTSAGLLIKSIAVLREVDPGFRPDNVLTMNVWLPRAQYPKAEDWHSFYERVVERVGELPGVEAAGVTSVLPISSNFDQRTIEVEGQPVVPGELPNVDQYIVTPDYLRAMSIAILRGRGVTRTDAEGAPRVVLVGETAARKLWPGEDALGKRVRYYGSDPKKENPWLTVVGIVRDVKQYGLDTEGTMGLYVPEAQSPSSAMTLVIHTASDPAGMVASVRAAVRAVDKEQAVFNVETMEQLTADSMALRRFSMLLLGLFAALALVLASLGIYGVMSYTVTNRTHEIGVRLALGARGRDILRLVVGQGMALALAGVAAGLAAAFALTRVMSRLLYGVSATDPLTFAGVAALLVAVALVACLIPARRAMKVDPIEALRYE